MAQHSIGGVVDQNVNVSELLRLVEQATNDSKRRAMMENMAGLTQGSQQMTSGLMQGLGHPMLGNAAVLPQPFDAATMSMLGNDSMGGQRWPNAALTMEDVVSLLRRQPWAANFVAASEAATSRQMDVQKMAGTQQPSLGHAIKQEAGITDGSAHANNGNSNGNAIISGNANTNLGGNTNTNVGATAPGMEAFQFDWSSFNIPSAPSLNEPSAKAGGIDDPWASAMTSCNLEEMWSEDNASLDHSMSGPSMRLSSDTMPHSSIMKDQWFGGKQILVSNGPDDSTEMIEHRPICSAIRTVRKAGWRKYGQKRLSNNMVRSYYRCSIPGCGVRRQVVTSSEYDGMAQVRTIGEHSHVDGTTTFKDVAYESGTHVGQKRPRKQREPTGGRAGSQAGGNAGEQGGRRGGSQSKNGVKKESGSEPKGDTTSTEAPSSQDTGSLPSAIGNLPGMAVTAHPGVTVDGAFTARLLETVPAFVVTDPFQAQHPILQVSSGFTDLTGYTNEDVAGKTVKVLEGAATDPGSSQRLLDVLSGNTPARVISLYYKKNGDPFWCLMNVAPVHVPDTGGKKVACVSHFFDISRRSNQ